MGEIIDDRIYTKTRKEFEKAAEEAKKEKENKKGK